jgi:hypothetical protein
MAESIHITAALYDGNMDSLSIKTFVVKSNMIEIDTIRVEYFFNAICGL